MTRLTRSGTRATVEAILGQPTKIGRQRLARQFAHEVLRATATGRCTDPRYTSREMLALLKKLGLALGFLAAIATSASAECAWVLWSRFTAGSQRETAGEWTNGARGGAAYSTRAECQDRIASVTHLPLPGSVGDWREWLRSAGRYASTPSLPPDLERAFPKKGLTGSPTAALGR